MMYFLSVSTYIPRFERPQVVSAPFITFSLDVMTLPGNPKTVSWQKSSCYKVLTLETPSTEALQVSVYLVKKDAERVGEFLSKLKRGFETHPVDETERHYYYILVVYECRKYNKNDKE